VTVPPSNLPAHNPGSGSPFDAIRQTVGNSGEYWSARDLMPLLGYDKWERFEDTIERAITAANIAGGEGGFSRHREELPGGGRPRTNYRLSRHACYLVAMVGDVNKPAVAAALAYFAVRTRQAETAPAFDPASLSRLDILKLAMQAEEEKAVLEAALESAAPAIAYHERFVVNDDASTVKDWAASWNLTGPQAWEKLLAANIVYRKTVGYRWSKSKGRMVEEYEYRARAGRVTFDWFDLRPQHNAPRLHNGQVRHTLYVRQAFALELGRKVGLSQPAIPGSDVVLRGGDAA
jgi:DNA-damage-inducible protein D